MLLGMPQMAAAMCLFVAILLVAAIYSVAFICRRQERAGEQMVGWDRWLGVLAPFARFFGPQSAIDCLRVSVPTRDDSTPDQPITLLRKDGTPFGDGITGIDPEIVSGLSALRSMMAKAVSLRVSDLHIEPTSIREYQVRCRIDGIMRSMQRMPAKTGRVLVSVLKSIASMEVAEHRQPQDGSFAICAANRRFDIRVASGPTNFGEKIFLRMLEADGGIIKKGLVGLGMPQNMARTLRDLMMKPQGMLIMSGPAGSGKTTTVYACLFESDFRSVSFDINDEAHGTLQRVFRPDWDVSLCGEIRDRETAEIAMKATLQGRFVFTTLQANDAASTILWLREIGVDISLMQATLSGVLAQRLVRLLCPHCKQGYEPSPDHFRRLGMPPDRGCQFFEERGCAACLGSGYQGRVGVYEFLQFDGESLREPIRRPSMHTFRQSLMLKVLAGETSLSEATRALS